MLTIEDAFRKFKTRLELNEREQKNASARHQEIREHMRERFKLEDDFLTGSYRRHTKTKPLKDVDIFCVLSSAEANYRSQHPSKALQAFERALSEKYGIKAVSQQRRSVLVDFGVVIDADDNTDYRVVSVDVVPAFALGDDYEIPDSKDGMWMKTNPKIHEQKAIEAHEAYDKEWKGLVRMMKYWNNHNEKPIKPSFLIEVMAHECLAPPFCGRFEYEFQSIFSTFADRICDPASLGPPVSDQMDDQTKAAARTTLRRAARQATVAIDLARHGKNTEALKAWRALFGPKYPLS